MYSVAESVALDLTELSIGESEAAVSYTDGLIVAIDDADIASYVCDEFANAGVGWTWS